MEFRKNRLVVDPEALDIYAAGPLKDLLAEYAAKGKKKVSIDLEKVERITTPALQVILSAKKSFEAVEITGLKPAIEEDLKRMGVRL